MPHLTKHFSEAEFLHSNTAIRRGLNNSWKAPEHRRNAINLLSVHLEPLREFCCKPIKILSGYRTPEVNAIIGGAQNSKHCTGEAVDFLIINCDMINTYNWLMDFYKRNPVLKFHKIIQEFNSWIHLSVDFSGNNSNQIYKTVPGEQTKYIRVEE